jgi:hypothetical protein
MLDLLAFNGCNNFVSFLLECTYNGKSLQSVEPPAKANVPSQSLYGKEGHQKGVWDIPSVILVILIDSTDT